MAIDANGSNVAEAPSVRKLAPVPSRACKLIAIAAFAEGDHHQPRFRLSLCAYLLPQGVRGLEIDLIAIIDHDAIESSRAPCLLI